MKVRANVLVAATLAGGAAATHLSDSLLHRVNDVLKEVSVYSYVSSFTLTLLSPSPSDQRN